MTNPVGRPSDYTPELANKVCEQISLGNSLKRVCTSDDMPSIATVFNWLHSKKEFLDKYEQAIQERTEAQHEQLLDLGDEAVHLAQNVDFKASNAVVSAVKLKADNMKWVMARMKPKKYGDKIDHTTNGKDLPQPIYGSNSIKPE